MTGRTGSARLVLRPQASSLPLGFFAFGMGTILLSAVELHWTALAQTRPLMIMVLVFVAPLELIAGLFPARDVGAATGLSLLGAAWVATALTVLRGPPGARSTALAIFLLMMTAIMLVLSAASLRAKPMFGLLLLVGACRTGPPDRATEREAGVRRQL